MDILMFLLNIKGSSKHLYKCIWFYNNARFCNKQNPKFSLFNTIYFLLALESNEPVHGRNIFFSCDNSRT